MVRYKLHIVASAVALRWNGIVFDLVEVISIFSADDVNNYSNLKRGRFFQKWIFTIDVNFFLTRKQIFTANE
jgi:hypothetical protein